jgi:hypothetical protein
LILVAHYPFPFLSTILYYSCIGTAAQAPGALPPTANQGMLDNKCRFCYRIRIENRSEQHVQLLGRYWSIQELVEDPESETGYDQPEPMVVNAPVTGAGTYCMCVYICMSVCLLFVTVENGWMDR